MALLRELSHRLQGDDEPLKKRLKLAENAFSSTDLPLTRKEEVILKWLCDLADRSRGENKIVWETLYRCLKFKTLSADVIFKPEIKELLVDTLIQELNHIAEDDLANVLQCCELILSTCEMQQYFQSKPTCLTRLTKTLVKSVFDLTKNTKHKTADVYQNVQLGRQCTAKAIECFVTCYKQSLSKNEFADLFLNEILFSACSLIDKCGNDKLGAEIHKCLQQLIFNKSRLSQFKSYTEEDENNFTKKMFEELKDQVKTADRQFSLVAFLYIFRAAIGSYKSDPVVIDLIFRNLIDSAGQIKIELLGCLRDNLVTVTFDYQNKINEQTLFEYLQMIVDEILSSKKRGATDFDALSTIAVLNPLIIETKLQDILKKVLLEEKKTMNECSSYNNLMISILDAQVRLRREQKLVPWILTAVKQTLLERENCDLELNAVFPSGFKDQFVKTIINMTSTQVIGIFRSLVFHLNAICKEFAESNKANKDALTFLLQANVDLMAAFFRGVRIFDQSVPLATQEKFAVALDDLGQTLSLLTETILKSRHDKRVVTALLTLTQYWDNIFNWLKYYAPDAVPEKLKFPLSQSQMQKLAKSIDNVENREAMNRILVQQTLHNLQDGTSPDLSHFLGGFEDSWSIILDQNPQILSSLSNTQVANFACLLLKDVKTSDTLTRLSAGGIQNDERLVKALICQSFVDLATSVNQSTLKTIVEHINVVRILDREKWSKVLKEVKKQFSKDEWTILDPESTSAVRHCLRILLSLPLIHLSVDLRTLVLLVAYAIKKECAQSIEDCELCSKVILDVTERSDISIMNYVNAETLVKDLPQDFCMRRAFESSLANLSTWEPLKEIIRESKVDDESVTILLECIEKTKSESSLKKDQKELLKKAERKLSKKLLDNVGAEVENHVDVKRISMALATIPADSEVPDNLSSLVKLSLDRIFLPKGSQDEELVAEGLQLVKVVLKKRSKFEMSSEIVESVWSLVMKNCSKELVGPLLERTQAKPLNRMFNLLHKQTILGLDEDNEACFANALIIWDAVAHAPMNAARDKCRLAAILNVLEALQVSSIASKSWPNVLKLLQIIFARYTHVIEKGTDLILMLCARSLREVELIACENVLAICSLLMKYKTDFVVERLPVLLALYRQAVRLVVRESRKKLDSSTERKLRCLALDIAKFTNSLVKLKKDLARISPYVIADFVETFSEGVIPSYVKGPLEDSVGHFLSICDNHAVSLLSRALPPATQEIFKKLYETYNKFYKYTGQI